MTLSSHIKKYPSFVQLLVIIVCYISDDHVQIGDYPAGMWSLKMSFDEKNDSARPWD